MQFFKRIIIIARNNGWIYTDPFSNYKIRITKVDRGYLTEDEIGRIMDKKFPTKRLEQVKGYFRFFLLLRSRLYTPKSDSFFFNFIAVCKSLRRQTGIIILCFGNEGSKVLSLFS